MRRRPGDVRRGDVDPWTLYGPEDGDPSLKVNLTDTFAFGKDGKGMYPIFSLSSPS